MIVHRVLDEFLSSVLGVEIKRDSLSTYSTLFPPQLRSGTAVEDRSRIGKLTPQFFKNAVENSSISFTLHLNSLIFYHFTDFFSLF